MSRVFKIIGLIALFITLIILGQVISVGFAGTGSVEFERNDPLSGIVIVALLITVFAGLKLFDSGKE